MEKALSTRSLVLQRLQKDEYVSGEVLANDAKVSRTAIWKAVKSLRNEGYMIDAVTNMGYKLSSKNDVMSEKGIREELEKIGMKDNSNAIWYYKTIDSTNNELKRIAASCSALRNCDGSLTADGKKLHRGTAIAATQTAGKGRLGRSFYSPDKNGIYMSLMYVPKHGVQEPARLTANAAVAVCRAIKTLYNIEAQVKWVNDIFINNRKVCGILTEGVTNFETGMIEAAIVGIGINMKGSISDLPQDIANVAGYVEQNADNQKTVTRNELVAQVIANLLEIYDAQDADNKCVVDAAFDEYKARSFLIGQKVTVSPVIGDSSISYEAKVIDIDTQMGLVVQNDEGKQIVLKSGEVSLGSYSFSKH